MVRSGLVGERATQIRPEAPGEREPLRGDFGKVVRSPRIENVRIDDRQAVPALRPDVAPDITEFQGEHALNPGPPAEHLHLVDKLAASGASHDRPATDGRVIRVGTIA